MRTLRFLPLIVALIGACVSKELQQQSSNDRRTYINCMQGAGKEYSVSEDTPAQIAEAAQGRCAGEYETWRGSSLQNLLHISNDLSMIELARSGAVETMNMAKAKVIQIVVEARLKQQ